MSALPSETFWRGKRVFLSGHTGFKGTWTQLWLSALGAEVYGYALAPDASPSLRYLVGNEGLAGETIDDIRDSLSLANALSKANPDIVLHMAAQPLVRRGYAEPVATFDINVMGTVHLLESVRKHSNAAAVLVITTDKVYANDESGHAFAEGDQLGGHDPYSASKAAAEVVTSGYRQSFFSQSGPSVATARAGNVLGGGDFAVDRLVPDIVRAAIAGQRLEIRNPQATRPWQHVLDCVCGYLLFAEALARRETQTVALNFGPPSDAEPMTVAGVAAAMQRALGVEPNWDEGSNGRQPREMTVLGLNPTLASKVLGWRQRLSTAETIEWTARWYADWKSGQAPLSLVHDQIETFMKLQDTTRQ